MDYNNYSGEKHNSSKEEFFNKVQDYFKRYQNFSNGEDNSDAHAESHVNVLFVLQDMINWIKIFKTEYTDFSSLTENKHFEKMHSFLNEFFGRSIKEVIEHENSFVKAATRILFTFIALVFVVVALCCIVEMLGTIFLIFMFCVLGHIAKTKNLKVLSLILDIMYKLSFLSLFALILRDFNEFVCILILLITFLLILVRGYDIYSAI